MRYCTLCSRDGEVSCLLIVLDINLSLPAAGVRLQMETRRKRAQRMGNVGAKSITSIGPTNSHAFRIRSAGKKTESRAAVNFKLFPATEPKSTSTPSVIDLSNRYPVRNRTPTEKGAVFNEKRSPATKVLSTKSVETVSESRNTNRDAASTYTLRARKTENFSNTSTFSLKTSAFLPTAFTNKSSETSPKKSTRYFSKSPLISSNPVGEAYKPVTMTPCKPLPKPILKKRRVNGACSTSRQSSLTRTRSSPSRSCKLQKATTFNSEASHRSALASSPRKSLSPARKRLSTHCEFLSPRPTSSARVRSRLPSVVSPPPLTRSLPIVAFSASADKISVHPADQSDPLFNAVDQPATGPSHRVVPINRGNKSSPISSPKQPPQAPAMERSETVLHRLPGVKYEKARTSTYHGSKSNLTNHTSVFSSYSNSVAGRSKLRLSALKEMPKLAVLDSALGDGGSSDS